MFRWIEIAKVNNRPRYEELSLLLKEQGFANSVEFIECDEEEFKEKFTAAMDQYDGIRIGRGMGELVLNFFDGNPVMVDQVRAADAVVRNHDGRWWLRANAIEGFRRILSQYGEALDFESKCLVVGSGAATRVAITGLFMAGVRDFSVSSQDSQKVERMIAEIERTHFGARFTVVPRDGLILLPGVHSILVNTTPMDKDNLMLSELNYFNFFRQGGLAVDFTIQPIETPLLQGVREIGARIVHGYQIAAATDMIWAEQVSGRKVASDFTERLAKRLAG